MASTLAPAPNRSDVTHGTKANPSTISIAPNEARCLPTGSPEARTRPLPNYKDPKQPQTQYRATKSKSDGQVGEHKSLDSPAKIFFPPMGCKSAKKGGGSYSI